MKIFLFLLLFPVLTLAQKSQHDTTFVNGKLETCDREEASYYIIKENLVKNKNLNEWQWFQSTYYKSGQIKAAGNYISNYELVSSPMKNGTFKYYYENGNLKSVYNFDHDIYKGEFETYYENGKKHKKGKIEYPDNYIYNDIDSLGIERIINGNGSICFYDSNLMCTAYYEVKDSLLSTQYFIDSEKNDTIFQMVKNMPQFPGGDDSLLKYLAQQIKYPKKARKNEISGVVLISFIINKEGEVIQSKIISGIATECDQEALRVINEMPQWKPGKNENRPVSVLLRIPVRFALK